ncbi:MAG: hypothetical protein Kow0080_12290 [Candidatus Promineifilaceae bacterium]
MPTLKPILSKAPFHPVQCASRLKTVSVINAAADTITAAFGPNKAAVAKLIAELTSTITFPPISNVEVICAATANVKSKINIKIGLYVGILQIPQTRREAPTVLTA